jgi:hypothetical protein
VPERLHGPARRRQQERGRHGGDREPAVHDAAADQDGGADGDRGDHAGQPREPRGVAQHDDLDDGACEHDHDRRRLRADADRGADQRSGERRELGDVVRVEDALGAAEGDGGGCRRAADREQPAGARVLAAEPGEHQEGDAARERHAEQPAGLAAEALVEQPQHAGLAAEHAAAARTAAAAGSAVLPDEAAEAVVAEDQRPDAVVARARDPGAVGRRRQPHQQRPREPGGGHRGSAGEQARHAVARRCPHPRGDDAGHHEQRRGHLRLEAEPDGHAGDDEPARAPVLEASDRGPKCGGAAEHEQGVGVVVARDGDGDGREHEHQARHESGRAAEPPPREVIGQADGRDTHERLRHEDAP